MHEPGHGGVRQVGHVQIAAGECPGDPGVDGAEAQITRAIGVGHVEQEGELGRRRVGCDAQPLLAQHETHAGRAQVLPSDTGADGLARRSVPHDRRGPLIGDADGVDGTSGCQRGVRAFERGLGHGCRVEFHEAGSR